MTATEELRRMLGERGVKYDDHLLNHTTYTLNGVSWAAHEYDGKLDLWIAGGTIGNVTPEQAIAATLSSCNCTNSERTETCHITDNGSWSYPYVCSACGASFDPDVNGGEFNFCPNCGRKVVP